MREIFNYLNSEVISVTHSLKWYIILSIPGVFFSNLFNDFSTWILDNYFYISAVMIAIMIDYFIGIIKHVIKRSFDWKLNITGLLLKTSMTVLGGAIFALLDYFFIKLPSAATWVQVLTQLAVFGYPAGSALKNMWIITDKKFPPKHLLDKIEGVFTNGGKKTINELTGEE